MLTGIGEPTPRTGRRQASVTRRSRAALLAAATATVLVTAGAAAVSAAPAGAAPQPTAGSASSPFGANVLVFDPSMSTAQIQAQVDAVAAEQIDNQFGTQRYALLFEPGSYGTAADPLVFQVGYYTEVDGLGASPTDVTIHGAVDVRNQCDASGCIALNNFWRSMSNLTIDVATSGQTCTNSEFWAVSQAAPLRRVNVVGDTTLMDYCTAGPQYASGGFIADSSFTGGVVINGSQQQFLTRNSAIDTWTNGVWNQVFAGDTGAPAQSFPNPPYTTLATTPVSREKPYLYTDGSGAYRVFVPSAARDSVGTTWQSGPTPGRSLPLSSFFVASPSDSAARISAALASGRNLLLTPGVYGIDHTLRVTRPDQVVLGLGFPTLTAENGVTPLAIGDVPGADVAGLRTDAGATNSPVLLQVGSRRPGRGIGPGHGAGGPKGSSADDPTALQDVFFRIGGPHIGKATVSLEVNSDHVVLDDIWAWRADHGTGVGWTSNTADTGVVVNGDDVTATGLFVEHYQKTEVVWNGEDGETVFFQNEMPYDAPDQAAWQHDGENGYPAYVVAPTVTHHQGYGMGSYIFTDVDPTLHAANGFEVPDTAGVAMHDLLTVSLNHAGTIDHVINGVGDPVTPTAAGPSYVTAYPVG